MLRSRPTIVLTATIAATLAVGTAALAAADLSQYEWNRDAIGADAANTVATGDGVIVAVIDSGVDVDHPEFAGRIVSPLSWAECPGVAPCTNLRAVDDGDGHGTHVSGTILAAADGVGTTGMAPDALLMPIRVFDDNGSAVGDVAAAIDHAVANGASVINLSLGYPAGAGILLESFVDGTNQAVARAAEAGVVVAFAAGNDSTPYCEGGQFVASTALCVGAFAELEASYSAWGLEIDILAPGGGFFTTGVPSTYPLDQAGDATLGTGYAYLSGTSMASPHVAGVAALLAEQGITGLDARERLIETASSITGLPFSAPGGLEGPRLDAAAAVGAS